MGKLKLAAPTHIDCVLVDWDGTLADTVPIVTKATNLALKRNGFEEVDPQGIHQGMQYPTLERMAFHLGMPTDDPASRPFLSKITEEFFAVLASQEVGRVSPFAGVKELLEWVVERGVPIGVVTNNRKEPVRVHAAQAGLDGCISCYVSEEDVETPKPDPEGIHLAMTHLRASAASTIYVGDSQTDAAAGRAAGVATVLADWARVDGRPLNANGFDLRFEKPREFLNFLSPRLGRS